MNIVSVIYLVFVFTFVTWIILCITLEYATDLMFKWIHSDDVNSEITSTWDIDKNLTIYMAGGMIMHKPGLIYTARNMVEVSMPNKGLPNYWEFCVYDSFWNHIYTVPMQKRVVFGEYLYPLKNDTYNFIVRTSKIKSKRLLNSGLRLSQKIDVGSPSHKKIKSYDETNMYENISEECMSVINEMEEQGYKLISNAISQKHEIAPISMSIRCEKSDMNLKKDQVMVLITLKRDVLSELEILVDGKHCGSKSVSGDVEVFIYEAKKNVNILVKQYIYGVNPLTKMLPMYLYKFEQKN